MAPTTEILGPLLGRSAAPRSGSTTSVPPSERLTKTPPNPPGHSDQSNRWHQIHYPPNRSSPTFADYENVFDALEPNLELEMGPPPPAGRSKRPTTPATGTASSNNRNNIINHQHADHLAQLSCDSGEMILRLNFSEPFKGIVYPNHNRLSACRFFGDGHYNYELRLPLRGCGTRQVSEDTCCLAAPDRR